MGQLVSEQSGPTARADGVPKHRAGRHPFFQMNHCTAESRTAAWLPVMTCGALHRAQPLATARAGQRTSRPAAGRALAAPPYKSPIGRCLQREGERAVPCDFFHHMPHHTFPSSFGKETHHMDCCTDLPHSPNSRRPHFLVLNWQEWRSCPPLVYKWGDPALTIGVDVCLLGAALAPQHLRRRPAAQHSAAWHSMTQQ